jgi:hypothetical protein
MGAIYVLQEKMEGMSCSNCGVAFSMPEMLLNLRRGDGETFYCPNGHTMRWSETALQKAEKELAREKQRREIAERDAALEKKLRERADKEAKRLRKRAACGVCPCCTRSFPNLGRHMQTKHPEYVEKG